MEFDVEQIVMDLAKVAADHYMNKDISGYASLIADNLKTINTYLDGYVENGSELYRYLIEIAYQYYRLNDVLK